MQVRLRVGDAGTAHVVVVDAAGIAGRLVVPVSGSRSGLVVLTVPLSRPLGAGAAVLLGWDDGAGGTFSSVATPK